MMNFSKRVCSILLALVTLVSLLSVSAAVSAAPATPTASVTTVKGYAGEKISINFYDEVCSITGSYELDNSAILVISSVKEKLPASSTVNVGTKRFSLHSDTKDLKGVTLEATISGDAKVGDICIITFTYTRVVEEAGNGQLPVKEKDVVKKVKVEVTKKPTATTAKPTTTTTKPATSKTTTAKPSTSKTTTAKPGASVTTKPGAPVATQAPVANLDLTELNKQITIAEALTASDYTADSWAQLTSALKAAKKARSAQTQNEVNKAAEALKNAIAALVRIDRSSLEQLLANINNFFAENDLASVWDELRDAISDAEAALKSGDQAAIDAAYNRLNAAFQSLKDNLAKLDEDKVVIQDGNDSGECTEKCHIWKNAIWHPLLIILLIISAVLNVGMGALIAWYLIKRKKNMADITPVVDYDINDD